MNAVIDLHIMDYVVFLITVGCSIVIGIYYAYKGRKETSTFNYHRGGGTLRALPVALSLLVTFESSIFFIGDPTEVYIHGFKYWLYNVGLAIGYSGLFWVSIPIFYPLQITSVFEYLQMRHDSIMIRRMATVLSTLVMALYAGIVLFGAAITLESVAHIPSNLSIICMVIIAVLYTSLGGIKAVVVTDVVQGIVMIIAIFAVLIYGTVSVGGVSEVISLNKPTGRLDMVDFDPNPLVRHSFWTLIIGGAVRCFGISFRQPAVQRLNSTKSIKEARKVVYYAIPGFVVLQLLVMMEGLVAFAYFNHLGCEPLAGGILTNPNQIISYTVMHMFNKTPGVTGLFIAALICASLSTLSSLLSSLSAVISEDIFKLYWKDMRDDKMTILSKVVVVVGGGVCIGVGIFIGQITGPLSQIAGSILDAIDGTMVGMFVLSIFFKITTKKGLIVGVCIGFCFSLWLSFGYNFSPGRKVTPWLPLGPVDNCTSNQVSTVFSITNSTWEVSTKATLELNRSSTSRLMPPEVTTHIGTDLYGLDYMYSVSYMYFSLLVLIVTLTCGLIVSYFTKADNRKRIPSHLVISLWNQTMCHKQKCKHTVAYGEVISLEKL